MTLVNLSTSMDDSAFFMDVLNSSCKLFKTKRKESCKTKIVKITDDTKTPVHSHSAYHNKV